MLRKLHGCMATLRTLKMCKLKKCPFQKLFQQFKLYTRQAILGFKLYTQKKNIFFKMSCTEYHLLLKCCLLKESPGDGGRAGRTQSQIRKNVLTGHYVKLKYS